MSVPPLPDLILYSRPGCDLCGEARSTIEALLAARRDAGQPVPELVERDIDTDPAWHDAFFATIPVVELGDRRLELVTGVAKVRRLLADILDTEPARR
ncbi:MAG TPA: glutaredoxin family protein [Candidatus Saccharimonadales bacterium]|nr:glutaredoxin family protein [Candidatus Saccharimonadales bacterium]